MNYTLGSLFSGSGGFELAGSLCGVTPVWASEIESYPIAVTKSRFPWLLHLGDVGEINGATIPPVDIVSAGSPCTDLSVAGKRAGIKHEDSGDDETTRSGLFMDAVRIIKEMREETGGKFPKYVLWENVPGAFSSNKGEDFRLVLEEYIKIAEPNAIMPPVPKGGWPHADCYIGNGWSIAYRVFDSQYWGVPQRRRRIYLVLDLTGQCAGEILFERESIERNQKTSRRTWKEAARSFVDSNKLADQKDECLVYAIENHPHDSRVGIDPAGKGLNLTGRMGTGGGNVPLIVESKAIAPSCQPDIVYEHIVRRLTPTECARLQGFPDNWGHPVHKEDFTDGEYEFWLNVRNTNAKINGKAVKDYTKPQMLSWYNKLHTDSAEYKMWGNGIALPCAVYCMEGIVEALNAQN